MYFDYSDDLSSKKDSRLVTISRWRKKNSDSHLESIYKKRDYGLFNGYLNFFNENSDIMSVGDAKKHLVWKMPNRAKKRRGADSINHYTTLCVYPHSGFYYCLGGSAEERKIAFRDGIRRSMNQLVSETGLPLKWVAAVRARYSSEMIAMIVTSKKILDPKTGKFKLLERCFPPAFLLRKRTFTPKDMSYMENTIAQAFLEGAPQREDFEKRIDNFIEFSRKFDFELPLNYYPYRYLDEKGNLMTKMEKMRSDFNKEYEQFKLTHLSPAIS